MDRILERMKVTCPNQGVLYELLYSGPSDDVEEGTKYIYSYIYLFIYGRVDVAVILHTFEMNLILGRN